MMSEKNKNSQTWQPLKEEALDEIDDLFAEIFPESEHGGLAHAIADYWIERLEHVWKNKPTRIREKDLAYRPNDPLSRVFSKTVVIAYPDSVCRANEATLETLDRFLGLRFPTAGGLHILPACRITEDRFNDGFFSQIKRNDIHERFGTNETFSRLAEKYFSMADFVLNHVDIENPDFRAYLDGDDAAGRCFYVFSENRYRKLEASGAFERIFRPRPFPLFTLFRRVPEDDLFGEMDFDGRCNAAKTLLLPDAPDEAVIRVFTIFEKIQNDQVLLPPDDACLAGFMEYLEKSELSPDDIFRLSATQESSHPPYIFKSHIRTRTDLLAAIGYGPDVAGRIARTFESFDRAVFGEQIRAMTTFSHVQVDVNTSTYEGLAMLADDFSWYLGLDINMLRLDAANYAFKKWHTSCFGLPEVKKLMRILYLSMDCVSPRIVANLEVNDRLEVILSQMADKEAPPPMMYDFHLPCILPAVFNTGNARILDRIFALVNRYDIPHHAIRFSLAESHDGKSVRGSMDLLRASERALLAEIVTENGGRIKYKATPAGTCDAGEFMEICRETGVDYENATSRLFRPRSKNGKARLHLKESVKTPRQIIDALGGTKEETGVDAALRFFADKMINGREPYELCCSTRDSLVRLEDETLADRRFLAFYTLAFALMGRNVKSVYFNDMMGLPNDTRRMERTGEYRDIKRSRSGFSELIEKTEENGIHAAIAGGIEKLLEIVDNDMALSSRGNEAATVHSGNHAVAVVYNRCGEHRSLTVVNTTDRRQHVNADTPPGYRNVPFNWKNRIDGRSFRTDEAGRLSAVLLPFQRLWLNPVD